jgi:hypothetical protein
MAYLAFGPGLVVVDAGDPAAPAELARLPLPGRPLRLGGEGDRLLVVGESGDVHLIDVADPAIPRLRWSWRPADGYAYAAAVRGELGYVDTDEGLTVLRLSGPGPERVTLADAGGYSERVRVCGDYLLLVDGGLEVLGLHDPRNPAPAFGLAGSGYVFDAAIDDRLLVMVGERLQVFAWEPPARPGRLASLSLDGDVGTGVALVGSLAYVSRENAGLEVFDLADPAHPVAVARSPTRRVAKGLWVEGETLYLADEVTSLKIYRLPDGGLPELAGVFRTPNEIDGLAVEGDYAYVAAWTDGLWIVDVSDPLSPLPLSRVGFGEVPPYGLALRVDVQDGFAYLASGGMGTEGGDWSPGEAAPEQAGVLVVDARDPAAPEVTAHLATPGEATGIDVRGNYACVADGWALLVVDVSDPAAPFVAGRLALDDDWLRDVTLRGDHAYLASSVGGVVVADVADPAAPRLVDWIESDGEPESVLAGDGVLFVGLANETRDPYGGTGGVEVYDLGNPDAPERIAGLDLGGEVWGMALDGDTLYASDRDGFVWVLDVADPAGPQVAGLVPTAGYPFDVAVSRSTVLVADYVSLTVLGD